jgi:hypothetical protein
MRLRRIPTSISLTLLVMLAVGVNGAGATSTSRATSKVSALRHVGISWVAYAESGDAPKACELQVHQNVDGVSCSQLPTYYQVLYCPAYPDESSWRDPAEQVVKVKVTKDGEGSLIIRASGKKSKNSARAIFSKVGGQWRIASVRSMGRSLTPAGLIFTDGKEIREALWPLHC